MPNEQIRSELTILARGVSLTGLWTVIGQALTLLVTAVIARLVGAEVLGSVALGISVLGILQILGTLGTDRGVLKYAAHFLGKEDPSSLRRTLVYATLTSAFLSLVLIVLYFTLLSPHIERVFPEILGSRFVIGAFVAATPVAAMLLLLINAVTALQRPQHAQFAAGVVRPLMQVGGLLLIGLWASKLVALTAATIAAYVVATLFLVFALRRMLHWAAPGKTSAEPMSDALGFRAFLGFSIPLAFIPALNVAGQQLDTALVGHFLTSAETGVYAVARRASSLAVLPLFVFGGILGATAAKLHAKHDHPSIRRIYLFGTKWIFASSAAVFITLVVGARDLLSLFGAEFIRGADVLRILAVGQVINASVGPSGNTLLVLDRERLVLLNSGIAAVMGVGLAVALIPKYALLGAASALAFTLATVNLISVVQLGVLLGIHPASMRTGLSRLLYVGASLAITYWLTGLVAAESLVRLAITAALAMLTIGGSLVAFEGLSAEDRSVIAILYERMGRFLGR